MTQLNLKDFTTKEALNESINEAMAELLSNACHFSCPEDVSRIAEPLLLMRNIIKAN